MIKSRFYVFGAKFLLLTLLCITAANTPTVIFAQQNGDYATQRDRAIQMANDGRFVEALPLFEKLAAFSEADAQIFFGLGLGALKKAEGTKDAPARKALRVKARTAFLKAQELGVQDPQLNSLIAEIKLDGGERGKSDNAEANSQMDKATAAFVARDYLKAAELYGKAAALDPTLYEAALYTGNSFYSLKEFDKAGIWFAKAIALDPNRETAYRYWADGLMVSGKTAEAQNKFYDAIIAEPYNQLAWRGLSQFAQGNNIKLAHPKIEIPINQSTGNDGNTTVTLGQAMRPASGDGSEAWLAYSLTRTAWKTGDFARKHPNEKVYRHSLAEEAAALRSVLIAVKGQSATIKQLSPDLKRLQDLENAGLLEAYILLARADAGVRRDYEIYRQTNRDKLKRYLAEYVVKNGGNVDLKNSF